MSTISANDNNNNDDNDNDDGSSKSTGRKKRGSCSSRSSSSSSSSSSCTPHHHQEHHFYLRSPLALPLLLSPQTKKKTNEKNENPIKKQDLQLRPRVCALLVACEILRVSVETQFTAATLLQRYYYAIDVIGGGSISNDHGKKDGDDDDEVVEALPVPSVNHVIAACLFLACKTEEEPRRLRDVVNCAHQIQIPQQVLSSASAEVEESSVLMINWDPNPPDLDSNEDYWQSKQQIVEAEQHVLRWLGLDCVVSHPHRAVVLALSTIQQQQQLKAQFRTVNDTTTTASSHQQEKQLEELQLATFQRLNTAVFSVQCLAHGVWPLACAALELEHDQQKQQSSFSLLLLLEDHGWYTKAPFLVSEEVFVAARTDLEHVASWLQRQLLVLSGTTPNSHNNKRSKTVGAQR